MIKLSSLKGNITSIIIRQRILESLEALPANQAELQERLHLSRSCVSSHIVALKGMNKIYISKYTSPVGRTGRGGTLIETYSVGNQENVDRPPLYNDKDWQRAKAKKRRETGEIEDYNLKQRQGRFLARKVPKLDPLAIMYARNEQTNPSGTTGNS